MANDNKTTDRDDFWDLGSLLPARRVVQRPNAKRDTEAVEIRLDAPTLKGVAAADSLFVEHPVSLCIPRKKKEEPLCVYQPQNALLHEVRVFAFRDGEADYYEQFARQARRIHDKEGTACPAVDFFSYAPQYTQMNAAQMEYYLWWRHNFRKGKCLPAAHSYQLLYVYEILNLGDRISPEWGRDELVRLWLSYRATHPRLDGVLREWIVDYSLIHGLPAPALSRSLYRELLTGAELKEFFVPLGESAEDDDSLTTAVMLFCNNYDYTKSKFYTEDTAAQYQRVLRGAVRVAVAFLRERDGELLTGKNGISTVSRDTFTGAICSWKLRKRVEVDYVSFSRTHELRYLMSDVLKYAENALRAQKGIKSRLSIYAVDVALRERLDAYLAQVLPPRTVKKVKKEPQMPEYEKRYDLPVRAPSLTRAAEIENDSWQTTKRLVEAFAEAEAEEKVANGIEKAPLAVPVAQPEPADPEPSTLASALGALGAFLSLNGARAQREFALAQGMMVDAIADKINTVAGDMLGDILLEEGDDGYVVIEEYREILIKEGVLNDGK